MAKGETKAGTKRRRTIGPRARRTPRPWTSPVAGPAGASVEPGPRLGLEELCEFGPVGYFTLSPAGLILAASHRGARLLNSQPGAIRGRSLLDFMMPGSRDAFREHLRAALRTGLRERLEAQLSVPHDRFRHVSFESVASRSGQRRAIFTAASDITDRVAAERQAARLVSAVEQAGDAMAIIGLEGPILYVNQAFEEVDAIAKSLALGKSYFRLFERAAEDPDWQAEARAAMAKGGRWSGRVRRAGPDGRSLILDLTFSPIFSTEHKIFSYLVVERDVTRETELEAHMSQIQKLEAIGTLAGGIAHDLNNILGPIILNTELALLDDRLEGVTKAGLESVLKAALRAKELVRQVLVFSANRETARTPVRLAEVVRDTVALLRASLPATIEIRLDADRERGLVLGDPTQISQVLVNLVNNAAQAMGPDGGPLAIALSRIEWTDRPERSPEGLRPGSYLRLDVTDTGPGIPAEIMDRIFDPFFTTKPAGQGTGMGLSVVRGIVRSHGGAVTAASEPGRGAVFTVYLPEFAGPEDRPAPLPDNVPAGRGRILLVDDEELQVESWKLALEKLGYSVTALTDSEAALRLFHESPDGFDVVITDQTMPRLTGIRLAERLIRLRPNLAVILCTGFSEAVDAAAAGRAGIRLFLKKPLSLREIAGAVRTALDGDGGAPKPKTPI